MLLQAASLAGLEGDGETLWSVLTPSGPAGNTNISFIHTLGNHMTCLASLGVGADVLEILDGCAKHLDSGAIRSCLGD